jgi:hypothetical protein
MVYVVIYCMLIIFLKGLVVTLLKTYVGGIRFLVDFPPIEFNPNNLPFFHSYKHSATDHVSFDVRLTPYPASGSQLVSITTLY